MRRSLQRVLGVVVAGWCGTAVAAPDITGGDLQAPVLWGTSGGITAYSFGATHCNVGTSPLNVVQNSNQHFVSTQNLFRYRVVDGSGRFEQLGQNWVFHSFCSLQTSVCEACAPACGGCCGQLGAGCSDSTTASRTGSQSQLGPRWQINPRTGAFPFPFSSPGAGLLNGRLQVNAADLDPAQNAGATYFAELLEIAPDDAAADMGLNNATYRRVTVGVLGGSGYPLLMSGVAQRGQPALNAWATQDAGVGAVQPADDPEGGRFFVASSATDLGDSRWHYEYAIYNLNSDRAAGSFSVPIPPGVTVENVGFHDVDYHGNGNPYSGADWTPSVSVNAVTWTTELHAANPNANALRWGTLYNFRFDANVPPQVNATASIGLFKPGAGASVSVAGMKAPAVPPPACPGDANSDSQVNAADLSVLLSNFGSPASGPGEGDFNNDGACDGADLSVLLGAFGTSC